MSSSHQTLFHEGPFLPVKEDGSPRVAESRPAVRGAWCVIRLVLAFQVVPGLLPSLVAITRRAGPSPVRLRVRDLFGVRGVWQTENILDLMFDGPVVRLRMLMVVAARALVLFHGVPLCGNPDLSLPRRHQQSEKATRHRTITTLVTLLPSVNSPSRKSLGKRRPMVRVPSSWHPARVLAHDLPAAADAFSTRARIQNALAPLRATLRPSAGLPTELGVGKAVCRSCRQYR